MKNFKENLLVFRTCGIFWGYAIGDPNIKPDHKEFVMFVTGVGEGEWRFKDLG